MALRRQVFWHWRSFLHAGVGTKKRRALQSPAMRSSTVAAVALLAACLALVVPRPASADTFNIQWRPATDVRVLAMSGDPDDTYNFMWEGNHSMWWGGYYTPSGIRRRGIRLSRDAARPWTLVR